MKSTTTAPKTQKQKQKEIMILNQSIEHYRRMEEWVKNTQDPEGQPDGEKMLYHLGENWNAKFCPLCKHYRNQCWNCVLTKEYLPCSSLGSILWDGETSEWYLMRLSNTWREWLEHAVKMREIMEKIKAKLEAKPK